MADSPGGHRSRLITPDTKITVPFVLLALLLWLAVTRVSDSFVVQAAILLGVGVVAPLLVTELRRR